MSHTPQISLNYADATLNPARPWGKGFLAVCGTVALCGLGHWIAGRGRRGLVWFVLDIVLLGAAASAAVFPRLLPVLLPVVSLRWIVIIAAMVDAFICGRKSSRPILGRAVWRYLAGIFIVAAGTAAQLALISFWRQNVCEAFIMPTRTMAPNLVPGDRFLVVKIPFVPRRWDLVAFHPPGSAQTYVKRVVGLPGERIEIVNNILLIDDVPTALPAGVGPYVGQLRFVSTPGPGCEGRPITLRAGEFYLLGDNSPISGDARYWSAHLPGHQQGALTRASMIGRVTAIYWPLNRQRVFTAR
ncbi:MAG TPA: signal peptidase I [Tepidisphaeraceae bacterium]|nr:signal peptidase I [Tepidisphaeraceae bacterium]